jgi:putative transposase
MKKSRFTEAEIVVILQEGERGTEARELCRRNGITETTFYRWRRKYGASK